MELMDSLDSNKWQTAEVSKKEGYGDYQIRRSHKKVSDTSYLYCVEKDDEEETRTVGIDFCKKDKDPLKNIGSSELKLNGDKVVGIDLFGDCVELKQ